MTINVSEYNCYSILLGGVLMVVAGFVLALLGLLLGAIPLVGWILLITATILVAISFKKSDKKGLSITSLIIVIVTWVYKIILLFILVLAIGSESEKVDKYIENQTSEVVSQIEENVENVDKEEAKKKEVKKEEAKPEDNVPEEYKSALKTAESYAETMHMSKSAIYDQLISEYGEQFSVESAKYAIDNLEFDWKANALKTAESYSETMHMSKQGIYDQIISENGEKFTTEEAQYAIDNMKADFNENALETAKSYQETMNMSPEAIRDQLTSEYGEKFTQEEANYAIENLKK